MKVIILCGGQGTRIRELTDLIPKPMIDIGGKPMIWHIMNSYANFGFTDFTLPFTFEISATPGDVWPRSMPRGVVRNSEIRVLHEILSVD